MSVKSPGADIGETFWDKDKALNFCARVFFANALFDADIITLHYSEIRSPDTLGFYYPARLAPSAWLVKTLIGGKVQCRWFDDLEPLYGWLRTQIENPTTGIIQIWSESCACPDDDPVPGVELPTIPFAS